MTNTERVYKLIEELQTKLADNWTVLAVAVDRSTSNDKPLVTYQIELQKE